MKACTTNVRHATGCHMKTTNILVYVDREPENANDEKAHWWIAYSIWFRLLQAYILHVSDGEYAQLT